MNNLIYLSLPWLSAYDPYLESADYVHNKWFHLKNTLLWPKHTNSRAHRLDTPWSLAPTVCPIPKITHNELRFDIVIEEIAEQFCQHANQSNKIPYICWSGGIDSTAILVSILKVADSDFLDKVTILYSDRSIIENSYFYYNYIDKKLKTQNIDTFSITSDNYADIIVVDGEAGNQIMGHPSIQRLMYGGQQDLLNQKWRSVDDLTKIVVGATQFSIDIIVESIKFSPVDIETVHDFLWWANFNLKFDDVLLRKGMSYTENLTPAESKLFFTQGLYRFYTEPKMQIWSMISKDLRRESTAIMPKHIPKKYIFDFDQNDFYYSNKREEGSISQTFFNKDIGTQNSCVFAVDDMWNKYNINDTAARCALGKILQRT
jgi:hypothetical protein